MYTSSAADPCAVKSDLYPGIDSIGEDDSAMMGEGDRRCGSAFSMKLWLAMPSERRDMAGVRRACSAFGVELVLSRSVVRIGVYCVLVKIILRKAESRGFGPTWSNRRYSTLVAYRGIDRNSLVRRIRL